MSTKKSTVSLKAILSGLIIPIAFIVSILVYIYIFGDGSHFQGGSNENMPLQGDYYGVIYKGGPIVPILMSLLLTVLAFTFERFFAIAKATGRGRVTGFIMRVNDLLKEDNIEEARELCSKQKGSVASVINSGLAKYQEMVKETTLNKEQKIVAIQKEIEEATSLELPTLQQNLVIFSTLTTLGTLMGLLGTVIGMIRAFSALATAGAPDAVALSTGISEALINTALGIGTAALAVIFYNIFTTKIDKLTYAIDETGFMIVNTFSSKH